jgi:hypothetical protein
MSYIGRDISYGNAVSQQITGNNGASYTLNYDTTTSGVVISLDGVVQRNSVDFNIVGTALTFTSTVGTGIIINIIFTGLTLSIGSVADGTVTDAKITAMSASKLTGTITPSNNTVDETKLKDALVADFTEVVVSASDSLLIGDATDGGNTKRDTVQGLLDLVPASGITQYISSFSYDQSTTGSVAVTGVGFTPTLLIAHTVQASSPEGSTGFGNATTEHALRFDHNNSANSLSWSNYIGQVLQSGSISCRWNIASFDADGFTYTKVVSGSPSGTNKVMFLAMK